MKILVVVPKLRGGGAEFVALTWSNWLARNGHSVHVHTLASFERPEALDEQITWSSPGSSLGHLALVRSLRKVVRSTSPDVCLSLQLYPNLQLLAATILGSAPPVVISERNLVSIGKSRQGLSHRAKILLAKLLYRRADRVVAISHPVAADLVGAFAVEPARCVVVNNPSLAKVGSADGSSPTTPAAGSNQKIVIVLACRLVSQKRPLVAVEVAAELNSRGHEVELWVFGAGPLAEDLRGAASESNVKLVDMGWSDCWFREVPTGAVHFLPSDQEGLGNVLVEAAGVGIRSVAYSGALGVADAVVPGITGVLVAEPVVKDFADAVESEAAKGPCDASEWLETFSETSSGKAIQTVLTRVVQEHSAGRTR